MPTEHYCYPTAHDHGFDFPVLPFPACYQVSDLLVYFALFPASKTFQHPSQPVLSVSACFPLPYV